MKVLVLVVSVFCVSLALRHGNLPRHSRRKRDATGSLDIVTNNAQPIHAEVKPDVVAPVSDVTEKPCPKQLKPSSIEAGTVFKVLPPKDDIVYEGKSLRKSWPLTSRLDLIRSVTRVATLAILVVSAVIEFYPLIQHLYYLCYF